MIDLAQRARNQDVAEEQSAYPNVMAKLNSTGIKTGTIKSPSPVTLGDRLELSDDVKDGQREKPEDRRQQDQQSQTGPVAERISQAFGQARCHPGMPPARHVDRAHRGPHAK